MITTHRWTCEKCYKANWAQWRWFLRVNDKSDSDNERLRKYEEAISKHVAYFGHEVIHKEITDTKIRRI